MSEVSSGKLLNIPDEPNKDNIDNVCWRTREGELIPIRMLKDGHLRNIALFLMGMGYNYCVASKETRVLWLAVLSFEWERRMALRSKENVARIREQLNDKSENRQRRLE
jgi:hypothetical protein